jgi:RimJ/RimL family protein N-acetyltransferase
VAFEARGLARIQLHTLPGNVASERVAEGAGFTREGLLRSFAEFKGERTDITMFSLLPSDL